MIQFATNNEILLDGRRTGLGLSQTRDKTVVYRCECRITGISYREFEMPHTRYSSAHPAPSSGAAGRDQLESDVRRLLQSIAGGQEP